MAILPASLLALAAAFPPIEAPSREAMVRGFTGKGELVYEAMWTFPGGGRDIEYAFVFVADARGKPLRVAESYDHDDKHESAQGQALVKASEGLAAGERLQDQYNPAKDVALDADFQPFEGPTGARLGFAVQHQGKDCALIATWSQAVVKLSGEVARDRCGDSTAQVVWRADGARAAVAWNLPGIGIGETPEKRAHVAYVSPRDLATVEVLDAGAGAAALEAFAHRAEDAGFHVMRKGAARGKRTASAVYARAGFEEPARAVAKLAGVTELSPLTWDAPAAITVALAK
jgi:hypothetical protein